MLKEGTSEVGATLWSEKEFGDAELVVDCRPGKSPAGSEPTTPTVQVRGVDGQAVKLEGPAGGGYHRFVITVRGRTVTVKRDGQETQSFPLPPSAPARGPLALRDTGGTAEFMNLYVRDL